MTDHVILLFSELYMSEGSIRVIIYNLAKSKGSDIVRFFRLTEPAAVQVYIGADSPKIPHHIATLRFSEVVNDQPE